MEMEGDKHLHRKLRAVTEPVMLSLDMNDDEAESLNYAHLVKETVQK